MAIPGDGGTVPPARSKGRATIRGVLVLVVLAAFPSTARGVLDLEDKGPVLRAGGFISRVTNVGIVGNAFLDAGRSFDPSFEFPAFSGYECMNYAALWVGAEDPLGVRRVSGGPLLEWRPTLDPEDRVRTRELGDAGTYRLYDDDGDGRVDEETLNGRDDDGDGRIDEDLGLPASEMLAADYSDDTPGSVNFIYPNGEQHVPLHLSVHQEAYAWSDPLLRGVEAVRFVVTNHGAFPLHHLYLGLFADLDARVREDRTGHLNDRIVQHPVSALFPEGEGVRMTIGGGDYLEQTCIASLSGQVVAATDGPRPDDYPVIGMIGLDHTVDPLATVTRTGPRFPAAIGYARAPAKASFRATIMVNPARVANGVVPITDSERYDALAGTRTAAVPDHEDDYVVLLSCGPFPELVPQQSLDFTVALIGAVSQDSLIQTASRLLFLHHGTWENLLPDVPPEDQSVQLHSGPTGAFNHEVCLEAPPGVPFTLDPDCASAYLPPLEEEPPLPPRSVHYENGTCVWTDADCSMCTPSVNGAETLVRWRDTRSYLPPPRMKVIPGDRKVTVNWDNFPEVTLGGRLGADSTTFRGYRVYRVADWRSRIGELPSRRRWELVATYTLLPSDTLSGELPLAATTDSTLDYERILYERPLYPVGRYRHTDTHVFNGFDYAYVVTALFDRAPVPPSERTRYVSLESPFEVGDDQVAVPHAAARDDPAQVWVVPNPFRGSAEWDRRPTLREPVTRHIDFMGLPRARCTIKIWSLAGDFVAQIDHDGSSGDGQASWDLVSRNGQDIASGIYLFSVDSALGHKVGRFVVIR